MRTLLMMLALALAGCGLVGESGDSDDPEGTVVTYQCESGRTIRVTYTPPSLAILEYEGRTVQMARVIAASGERYAGDELAWHAGGTTGLLYPLFQPDELIESCTRVAN